MFNRAVAQLGALLCGVFMITACSTETATTASTPASEETPARIQPATFDRNDPGFDFFNFCGEVTDQEVYELGLERISEGQVELEAPSSTCSFHDPELMATHIFSLNMGATTDEELLAQVQVIEEDISEKIEGVWSFVPNDSTSPSECNVTATTERGRLWFGVYPAARSTTEREYSCGLALEHFEEIYTFLTTKWES